MSRRVSRQVNIGGISLGGGLPPVIQTMWKDRLTFQDLEGHSDDGTPLSDAIVAKVEGLKKLGCGLLRFAVPDISTAEALGRLASMVSMPLVADIHFDHKIALRCLDFPIAKIRINPGNFGPHGSPVTRSRIEAVLSGAARRSVPIRIGINAGSLPRDLQQRVDEGSLETAGALVLAAERELEIFREFDFPDVLVSMKASSVTDTIKANRLLAGRTDAPLHIGVTEAGPLIAGVVRSTAALMVLLEEGIGDTIRVSLSDTMEKEVIAAREILGLVNEPLVHGQGSGSDHSRGVRIVSCPRCGRAGFDTIGFTERWQTRLYSMDNNITVAIMGCEVNGPGEARHADLGITGTGNKVLIFRHGKVVRTVDATVADKAFEEELSRG